MFGSGCAYKKLLPRRGRIVAGGELDHVGPPSGGRQMGSGVAQCLGASVAGRVGELVHPVLQSLQLTLIRFVRRLAGQIPETGGQFVQSVLQPRIRWCLDGAQEGPIRSL